MTTSMFSIGVAPSIVSGPSTSRLIDGFKYAFDDTCQDSTGLVNFTLLNNVEFSLRVEVLAHENASGHTFYIEGPILGIKRTKPVDHWIKRTDTNESCKEIRARIYYNSLTHTGTLQIFGGEAYALFIEAAGM